MLLLLDSLTPVLGAASTLFFKASSHFMVLYLGIFCRIPALYRSKRHIAGSPQRQELISAYRLTVLGVIFIYIVTRFA